MTKKLSLIVCTYMRPKPLATLLASVQAQTVYPDEILIIDGSVDDNTNCAFAKAESKTSITTRYRKNIVVLPNNVTME